MRAIALMRPVELSSVAEKIRKCPPGVTDAMPAAPDPVPQRAVGVEPRGIVSAVAGVRPVDLPSVSEQIHELPSRVAHAVAAAPNPILERAVWVEPSGVV